MATSGPIGVFDSGIGGLTVFGAIAKQLPQYDYLYLGDNKRSPYGNRSFNTIHEYTWECVQWLFKQGCPLVILACNTASSKALRTIQQKDLKNGYTDRRVLGVIRPTAEVIGNYSDTKEIGVLGTTGTVESGSYQMEIAKFFPDLKVYPQACPLWVPLIENGEYNKPGSDYFVRLYVDEVMAQSANIDTLLLACTHYPLLEDRIKASLPPGVKVVGQGDIVAASLADYLQRHPEIEEQVTRGNSHKFYTTTDDTAEFDKHAAIFFPDALKAEFVNVEV